MSSLLSGTEKTFYRNLIWTDLDELPIWNWNKIAETGDLLYLLKNQNKRKPVKGLVEAWESLQQQYLDEFGVDMNLLNRIKTMKKIIKLNVKFYETRDRSLLNLIAVEENRLKESQNVVSVKFTRLLIIVSSHMGFRIDPKQFTVIEWFHALKNMAASHGKADKGQ